MSNLRIEFLPGENGGPDLVEMRRVGDLNSVIYKVAEKVDFLQEHFPHEMAAYEEHGAGGGISTSAEGTPLTVLKGVGARRAKTLVRRDVATVEQLAELSDASVSGLGAGVVDLRRKARDYLADQAGVEPVRTVG
jgi:predicted flap endonuclease-1-like 5' DNA nuclease|tara:strand:- start:1001 stop:1405 length:405 start_codon:yes stop_codon:yes gene_type:complete